MRFAGAMSAIRLRDGKVEHSLDACVLRDAHSEAEAVGFLSIEVRKRYPSTEGWQSHSVCVAEVK